jgi:hypothetical protein
MNKFRVNRRKLNENNPKIARKIVIEKNYVLNSINFVFCTICLEFIFTEGLQLGVEWLINQCMVEILKSFKNGGAW